MSLTTFQVAVTQVIELKDATEDRLKRVYSLFTSIETALKDESTELSQHSLLVSLAAILEKNGESLDLDTIYATLYLLRISLTDLSPIVAKKRFEYVFQNILKTLPKISQDFPALKLALDILTKLINILDDSSYAASCKIIERYFDSTFFPLLICQSPKLRKWTCELLETMLDNSSFQDNSRQFDTERITKFCMDQLDERIQHNNTVSNKVLKSIDLPKLMHILYLIQVLLEKGSFDMKYHTKLLFAATNLMNIKVEYVSLTVHKILYLLFPSIYSSLSSEDFESWISKFFDPQVALISKHEESKHPVALQKLQILSGLLEQWVQHNTSESFKIIYELIPQLQEYFQSTNANTREQVAEIISHILNCLSHSSQAKCESWILRFLKPIPRLFIQQTALDAFLNIFVSYLKASKDLNSVFMIDTIKWLAEIRGNLDFKNQQHLDEAFGQLVRILGPNMMLDLVPVDLELESPSPEARTNIWLLQILAKYTLNTQLSVFFEKFIGVTESLYDKMENLKEKKSGSPAVKLIEQVIIQIWSCFPAFCIYPTDIRSTLTNEKAQLLATLLNSSPYIRAIVCHGLRNLVLSSIKLSNTSISDPEVEKSVNNLTLKGSVISVDNPDLDLRHLSNFSFNYILVLINISLSESQKNVEYILQTIRCFSCILSQTDRKKLVIKLYEAIAKFFESNEYLEKDLANLAFYIDAANAQMYYFSQPELDEYFDLAMKLFKLPNQHISRKASKIIIRLSSFDQGAQVLNCRLEEWLPHVMNLEKNGEKSSREALRLMSTALPLLDSSKLAVVVNWLPKILISIRDVSVKVREEAFGLLQSIADVMEKGGEFNTVGLETSESSRKASLQEFLTMICAGLVNPSPMMIAGTISALSNLVYTRRTRLSEEYQIELISTIECFLSSNAAEVVKAALGFIKMAYLNFSKELLSSRLPELIPTLVRVSHNHNGHFRAKVKSLLERLFRRYGFEEASKYVPEEDYKLVQNIKKLKQRKEKLLQASIENKNDNAQKRGASKYDSSDSEFDEISDQHDFNDVNQTTDPCNILETIKQNDKYKDKHFHKKDGFKLDAKGRIMISERENTSAKSGSVDQSRINTNEFDNPNHTMNPMENEDGMRRGQRNKLKYSNKRNREHFMDVDEDDSAIVKPDRFKAKKYGRRK